MRKSLKRKPAKSNERYKLLFDSNPNPMWIYDTETLGFLAVNDAALQHYGYDRDEFLALKLTDIRPAADAQKLLRHVGRHKSDEFSEPWQHRKRDGSVIDVEISATDIVWSGRPARLIHVLDVTSRRQAERALREREAHLRAVIDTAHDAFVTIDVNSRITDWSLQAEAMFGWSRQEIMGKRLVDTIMPPSSREAHLHGVENFLKTGEGPVLNRRIEVSALHRAGHEIPIELTVWSMKTGNTYSFNAFLRDIRERRRAEEVVLAHAELGAASSAKSEFLSALSHELRTPLNAIIGYSEILKHDFKNASAEQREFTDHILNSGRHLLELINDILDLSKIEARKIEIDLEPVDLGVLLADGMVIVRELATTQRVRVENYTRVQSGLLLVDRRRVKQILYNLLSNAVKFTPPGGLVKVEAAVVDRKQAEAALPGFAVGVRMPLPVGEFERFAEISVTDSGVGIDRGDMNRLFTPFTQLENPLSGKFTGTGLGLALVRQLTELHGGALAVTSEVGKGSCFTVWLPWRAAPSSAIATIDTHGLSKPSHRLARVVSSPAVLESGEAPLILVAEDNAINRSIALRQLGKLGYRARAVQNGQQAVEQVQETAFALVLMDCQMPVMDGLEATRRIRELETRTGGHIPIVAMTANAMEGDRDACIAAGMDDYISKPVEADMLKALLERSLSHV